MKHDEFKQKLGVMINDNITALKERDSLHKKLCASHTPPKEKKNLGSYDRTVARKIFATETTKENRPKREAAYQRAIIREKTASWPEGTTVAWMDIELPCVLGKAARQCSIDLIGKTNGGKIVLCELKYVDPKAESKSNSPTYALLELLIYHYHIQANARDLEELAVWHTDLENRSREWSWNDCKDPENIVLAVVANPEYWNRWNNGNWKKKVLPEIRSILNDCPQTLLIKFFSTLEANPLFSEQDRNGNGDRYCPKPLNGGWTEIEELK